MNAVQNENFKSLTVRYFDDRAGPKKALGLWKNSRPQSNARPRPNLKRLLRHHSEQEISDAETYKRDGFDQLLAYYSVIEVASIFGHVDAQLPQEYLDSASAVLNDPAIADYYELNYPLPLVEAHKNRLNGKPVRSLNRKLPAPIFSTFLELGRAVDSEWGNAETFLWFLDGGERDEYSITDTIEVLREPKRFLRAFSDDHGDDCLSMSVQGFVEFLDFAIALDHLLVAQKSDLVQSVLWHHHGYWFNLLSHQVGRHVNSGIDALASWNSSGTVTELPELQTRADVSNAKASITRLCYGKYAWPFLAKLHNVK